MTQSARSLALRTLRIFTDASWARDLHGRGIGAWGAVLVWTDDTGSQRIEEYSGTFKQECIHSTAAEAQAIACGMSVIRPALHLSDKIAVDVFTDCQTLIKATNPNVHSPDGCGLAMRQIRLLRRCLESDVGVQVAFRWIEGHAGHKGEEHEFNDRADRLARSKNPALIENWTPEAKALRKQQLKRAKEKLERRNRKKHEAMRAHGIDTTVGRKFQLGMSWGFHQIKPCEHSRACARNWGLTEGLYPQGPRRGDPRKLLMEGAAHGL